MASSALSSVLSSKALPLDPNLDLASAFKQIEADRQNQVAGVTQFGQNQDSNLQNIYSQLQGGIKSGADAQAANYAGAAKNIGAAYDTAGTNQMVAGAQTQGKLADIAGKMGLDTAATQSVQGDLLRQSNAFALRNASNKADRVGSMQELGGKMTAVAQLGVQAAQQAEAQGRKDLSTKIQTELQRIQTGAVKAQSDFTGVKAQQIYKQTLQAETLFKQAQSQMASEQRQARSQAMSEQRMSQSQANSDRSFGLAQDRFSNMLAGQPKNPDGSRMNALQQLAGSRQVQNDIPTVSAAQGGYSALWKAAQNNFGPAAFNMINNLLGGMSLSNATTAFHKLYGSNPGNLKDIQNVYSQLKNMRNSGG